MKLYGFPASPFTRRVLVSAALMDVELDFVLVDLTKNAQREPDYLALNPTGLTPTLVDGEFVLWESNAIMSYLAETASAGEKVWPRDPRQRADVQRWMYWELGTLAGAVGPQVFELGIKPMMGWGEPDQEKVAAARKAFEGCAAMLDEQLSARDWLAHSGLSLADVGIGSQLVRLLEIEQPLSPWPALERWFRRVETLDAWQAVLRTD